MRSLLSLGHLYSKPRSFSKASRLLSICSTCPQPQVYSPTGLPIAATGQTSLFSTTSAQQARDARKGKGGKRQGPQIDKRITLIRYHLNHPLTPRPLRFSRLRALRHWTIHRAYLVYRRQQREAQERELERMYNSMRDACEALRNLPWPNGDYEKSQGVLFRRAMEKKGIWRGWPIEASRIQTEYPAREPWDAKWRR